MSDTTLPALNPTTSVLDGRCRIPPSPASPPPSLPLSLMLFFAVVAGTALREEEAGMSRLPRNAPGSATTFLALALSWCVGLVVLPGLVHRASPFWALNQYVWPGYVVDSTSRNPLCSAP